MHEHCMLRSTFPEIQITQCIDAWYNLINCKISFHVCGVQKCWVFGVLVV